MATLTPSHPQVSVPSGGLTINGTGGTDTLIVTGTAGSDTASINGSNITFNGSAIAYTGIQSIIINGSGGSDSLTQTTQPGVSFIFDGDIGSGLLATDSLTINAGSYTFQVPAAGQGILPLWLSSLSIGSGASVVVPNAADYTDRWLLVVNALSIAGTAGLWTGKLDLNGNDLVIHNGNLGTLTNQIASGNNAGHGYWNGQGNTSSTAASSTTFLAALGAIQGSGGTFDGQNITATDVLVKYTFYGDANLTGKVDGSDYSRIDNGYLNHLSGWYNGDFNYDGVIDGSDYTLIDNAFNNQGAQLAAQIAALAARVYTTTNKATVHFAWSLKTGAVGDAVSFFTNSQMTVEPTQDTEDGVAWIESGIESDSKSLKPIKRKNHDVFQNEHSAFSDIPYIAW
jgi:hypothetical protein